MKIEIEQKCIQRIINKIWFSLFKVGEINDTPAYFKGTRWRVIFMFDTNFATGMVSQQWPGVLLRRWYDFVNQICRGD